MKNILFIILIFPLFLFANEAEVDSNYTKGLEAYKSKDYQTCYGMFKKIYLKKLSDVEFNFYFGRSAYETGNYETALASFERVDILTQNDLRNKLEIAKTYFMLKMYEDSEIAYKEVLQSPYIAESLKRDIELALAKISKVQQKSFTYATVMLKFLHDSNINYGSIRGYEYAENIFNRIDPVSDTASEAFANLVNVYDIGYKNGFAIKNSLSIYAKDYTKHNDYNILFLSYNPSLIYKETHYTTELLLGADTMELAKKKYLSSASFMPRFELNHSPTFKSIAYFKYQRKKFTNNAQSDLDSNRYELSYGVQNILTPHSYLQTNVIALQERKIRGNNVDVDYDEIKANLNYANQFTKKYSLDFYSEVKSRNYTDFNSGFNSTRDDLSFNGEVGFSMLIAEATRLRLSHSYEYVNSNQERFSYKKRTTTVGLNKSF